MVTKTLSYKCIQPYSRVQPDKLTNNSASSNYNNLFTYTVYKGSNFLFNIRMVSDAGQFQR